MANYQVPIIPGESEMAAIVGSQIPMETIKEVRSNKGQILTYQIKKSEDTDGLTWLEMRLSPLLDWSRMTNNDGTVLQFANNNPLPDGSNWTGQFHGFEGWVRVIYSTAQATPHLPLVSVKG